MISIPHDKLQHALGGACLASAFTSVSFWWHWGLVFSTVAVIAIAFGKEVYDYRHRDKHTPEMWDFLATVAGGAAVDC